MCCRPPLASDCGAVSLRPRSASRTSADPSRNPRGSRPGDDRATRPNPLGRPQPRRQRGGSWRELLAFCFRLVRAVWFQNQPATVQAIETSTMPTTHSGPLLSGRRSSVNSKKGPGVESIRLRLDPCRRALSVLVSGTGSCPSRPSATPRRRTQVVLVALLFVCGSTRWPRTP